MDDSLSGKNILAGVTGSIAAFKACELVSRLVQAGASVRVVMTGSGSRFVSPLTFEALSGRKVYTDMFATEGDTPYAHLELAEFPHAVVIAPATANVLGKLAAGVADDLLSTILLAVECPIIIAPAMNSRMFLNRTVQENMSKLISRGVTILPPGEGPLACGETGPGRLTDIDVIVNAIRLCLSVSVQLEGKRVLVTAGRTEEPLDPVRFITNGSSGKMGYAVARAARRRSATVTLVSGPTNLTEPYGIERVPVRTAGEMQQAVLGRIGETDILVMAAAVGDFTPAVYSEKKLSRGKDPVSIDLVPTMDILKEARKAASPETLFVGFAVEYEQELERARGKLREKGLDMIVVNNPAEDGSGFGSDTNRATILIQNGDEIPLPLMSKDELADRIFDAIASL